VKYKSLSELRDAFARNEIPGGRLIIDNDCCWVVVPPTEEGGEWETVYAAGGPNDLIWEAMSLLGIPCEGA
jgi:hypothetical protein